jgi:hypothetical protein
MELWEFILERKLAELPDGSAKLGFVVVNAKSEGGPAPGRDGESRFLTGRTARFGMTSYFFSLDFF